MKHLLENNLIKESQIGFMPGRSYTTNLVIFMDILTEIVDRGKPQIFFILTLQKLSTKSQGHGYYKKWRGKESVGKY